MNLFCCLCEDQHVLLGIPPHLSWTIKATPCEDGCILKFCIDEEDDILLLDGKPVNLSTQSIEVKDTENTFPAIVGTIQSLNIIQISKEISYFEIIRHSENAMLSASAQIELEDNKADVDDTVLHNWSKILVYLEDLLGVATVSAWLDDATVTEFTEDTLKIRAGTRFKCDIVRRRCVNYIRDALAELFHSNASVEVFAEEV